MPRKSPRPVRRTLLSAFALLASGAMLSACMSLGDQAQLAVAKVAPKADKLPNGDFVLPRLSAPASATSSTSIQTPTISHKAS